MSWQATAAVAEITEGISRSEKLVLLCLANRHNIDQGVAYPSIPRLAREAMMSERTCYRVLSQLQSKGFVEVHARPGRSSFYSFTPAILSGVVPSSGAENVRGPLTPVSPTPDAGVTPTPDTAMSPKPKARTENEQEQVTEPAPAAGLFLGQKQIIGPAIKHWETEIGFLPSTAREEFDELVTQVPDSWYIEAVAITKKEARRPNWKFCATILRRCIGEQRPPGARDNEPADDGSAKAQLLGRFRQAGGA